jgi:hypothetical protein
MKASFPPTTRLVEFFGYVEHSERTGGDRSGAATNACVQYTESSRTGRSDAVTLRETSTEKETFS